METLLILLLLVVAGLGLAFWLAPRQLILGAFRLCLPLFRVEVVGAEHLQTKGPAVYVANHTSLFDGPLLIALIQRRLGLVVYTTWAKGRLLRLVRSAFDIISIDPMRPMSAKAVAKRVSDGEAILIFPEGRITVMGGPMKINAGAAWLVDAGKADLIAIHIEGMERSMGAKAEAGWRRVLFPKVRVVVSPPQRLEVAAELRGKVRREVVTAALRNAMEDLRFRALFRHDNLLAAMDEARQIHGNRRVVYEDVLGAQMTYRQLRLGGAVLGQLFADELQPDQRVGLLLPTASAATAVLMGLWRLRVTPAVLNHTVGAAAVATSLGVIGAKVIVSSRTFVEKGKLGAFVADLEAAGIRFLWLEDMRQKATLGLKLWAFFGRDRLPQGITRDTPAAILFTSGTEGAPKGVVLSHGNILANICQLRARTNIGPKDVSVSALPAFHSFGLTVGLILPVVSGIRTGLHPSPLHYRVIPELAYALQATLLFGTDTFIAGWAKRADPQDFASLRAVVAGAEAVKDRTRKLWSDRFGVRILEGYGATECAPVLSLITPAEPDIGTVGRLLPGMKMRLEPMPGIEGQRLIVSGPNVMLGYMLESAPGQIQPPPDGWYDTGDAVTVDGAGRVRIVGRIKRFAKVGGEMVSLQAVENMAQALWPQAAVAAMNRPHPRTGEQVVVVTTKAGAERAEILAYAKAQGIGSILLPSKVIVMEKIPLLASGKTDYPTLQKLLEASGA